MRPRSGGRCRAKNDVMIRSVYVAVAGGHIQVSTTAMRDLAEERDEIDDQDVEECKDQRAGSEHSAQNAFFTRSFSTIRSTAKTALLNPIGMLGGKLEADFHIIHGVRTRIQNTIRCVKELPLEVETWFLARSLPPNWCSPSTKKISAIRSRHRRRTPITFLCRRRSKTSGAHRDRRRSHPMIFPWGCGFRWPA